jgi:hypothetical protein
MRTHIAIFKPSLYTTPKELPYAYIALTHYSQN